MARDASRLRAPLTVTLVGLSVVLALAPSAAAHGEHGFEQNKLIGDLFVSFGLESVLPMASTPTQAVIGVSNVNRPGDTGVEDVRLTLFDPANETFDVDPYPARGAWNANATFHTHGTWRANLTLLPSNQTAEFTFPVYAEGPYVWDSPNAATGLFAVGAESEVEFIITEWMTLERAAAPWDVTVRLEHWTDDHSTMLSREFVETEPTGPGAVMMTHVFNATGMYHAYLASPTLDLEYDDRPYVHVYALPCEEAVQYDPEHACITATSTTPGAGALVGLVGVAAAALASSARRRA